jgi:hypothetical protein
MVAFALEDVRRQTIAALGGQRRAVGRARLAQGFACSKEALAGMMAFVVLPHCMQTAAHFWSGAGFEVGSEVRLFSVCYLVLIRSTRIV